MAEPLETLLGAAIASCEAAPAEYLTYGGLVAGLWGEPRMTADVDLVLFLAQHEFVRFLRSARRHGFDVDEDLAHMQLQVSGWARLPFGQRDAPWHMDVTIGDSPFDASARARRRQVRLWGRDLWAASPEDLVIYKSVASLVDPERLQDPLDVEAVFRRMGPSLDVGHMRTWAVFWEQQGIAGIAARIEHLWARWGGG